MGGQQPITRVESSWSKSLFSEDKISGTKTQDEKLRELQTEFREFCRRIESSVSDHADTVSGYEKKIAELTTEVGFLKSVCDAMNIRIEDGKKGSWNVYQKAVPVAEKADTKSEVIQTKLSAPNEPPENEVYLSRTELREYIENLRHLGKIKCDSPLFLGAMTQFSLALGIVEGNEKWKSTVRPTKFGIHYGYVIPRGNNQTAIKYNAKKMTDLWVRASGGSANFMKVVTEFQGLQREFYGNLVNRA